MYQIILLYTLNLHYMSIIPQLKLEKKENSVKDSILLL